MLKENKKNCEKNLWIRGFRISEHYHEHVIWFKKFGKFSFSEKATKI